MKKRQTIAIASSLLGLTLLTGCGNDDKKTTETSVIVRSDVVVDLKNALTSPIPSLTKSQEGVGPKQVKLITDMSLLCVEQASKLIPEEQLALIDKAAQYQINVFSKKTSPTKEEIAAILSLKGSNLDNDVVAAFKDFSVNYSLCLNEQMRELLKQQNKLNAKHTLNTEDKQVKSNTVGKNDGKSNDKSEVK